MQIGNVQIPKFLDYEKDTLTSNYGKFIAEPFERGYGQSVGNSLRRILLSSITGSAVTSVKFEGVSHEFSSIPGVVEDTMEIILNLKELKIKLFGPGPKILRLSVKGERKVTAADIQAGSDIEILNPQLTLATLTDRKSTRLNSSHPSISYAVFCLKKKKKKKKKKSQNNKK